MLWSSDTDGRFAAVSLDWDEVNGAAETGLPVANSSEIMPRHIHPEDLPGVQAALRSRRAFLSGQFRIKRDSDQDYLWVRFVATPARALADGSFSGYTSQISLLSQQPGAEKSAGRSAEPAVVDDDYPARIAELLWKAKQIAGQAKDRQLVKVIDFAIILAADMAETRRSA